MDSQQQDQQGQQGQLDALCRDPYPLYTRARATDGLTYVPELRAWLVARDADVREVLRRPEDFSSANALSPPILPAPAALAELRPEFGGHRFVVSSDGAEHERFRAPLTRALSATRVAALVPYAAERATALIDDFASEGRAELMAAYAMRLPGEVIGRVVGLDPVDVEPVLHGGHRVVELLFRPLGEAEQVAAAKDVAAMHAVLDTYVRARHADPRDDLCSVLVADMVPGGGGSGGELTVSQSGEVVAHLQNFLLAGHLTTTALIGTMLLHLLRHPAQWELLCAEPERIPAAVEEAARYDTALQAFHRVTTRPVTLAGSELPAGADVLVAFGAAGRDGACHERPDAFDIERPPEGRRHLAFGLGVHGCVGARLAREQLRLTLELFTRRFPGLRLDEERLPVTMRPSLIHRSPEALHVRW
ncbi:cytochrome P450 [Actinomycetota bacterium Odt1-20B]